MNRLYLLLSKVAFGAILLLLVSSSAAFAQVTYTLTGTLNYISGTGLNVTGDQVIASTTISQSMIPTSSVTTTASSSNTYTGVPVSVKVLGLTVNCTALSASQPVTVVITDNVGAPDTIAISNCELVGLASVSATATLPDGNLISAVPAVLPTTVDVISTS